MPGHAESKTDIEECLGRAKTVGGLRESQFVGRDKAGLSVCAEHGCYNTSSHAQSQRGGTMTEKVSRGQCACG